VKTLSALLIFILLVICSGVLAEVPRAEFTFATTESTLPEGELLEGMIKIWPIENADLEEFKKLQGQSFMNSLELLDLQSVSLSENNADVVEIKGLFVASKKGSPSLTQIPYKGQFISIGALPFSVESIKQGPKDYFIMSQSLTRDILVKVISIVAAAFLFVALVWKRKVIIGFFKNSKKDQTINKYEIYKEKFLNAKERIDIESIYAAKIEWISLTEKPLSGVEEFSRVMELHQYKKEWREEEFNEVKESLDVIRRSFT
jgi:hypothetical protein